MAQTGYTPIQLYRTTTAAAVPLTANLAPGELAINIANTDMALFAENASGTVTRIMNNPAGLKYPTADGTANQVLTTNGSGTLSFSAAAPTNGYRRNKIINGGMAVDQRNAGASQTFTAAAALAYSVDRFYGYCTGANVTGQRVAGAGIDQYRYRFTGAASVTAIGFAQRIEAANSYDLNNGTAFFSVDLANSLLTTVTWTAYYATTADTFGTLASPTRTQIATGTFTVTSTVTNYTASISIPSAATTGIEIVLTVGAQTSGTWTIGNVQLEAGSSATPFERLPIGQTLALCQRYYQTGSLILGFGSFAVGAAHLYPIGMAPKRVTPSVATQASSLTNVSSVTNSVNSPSDFTVTVAATGIGNCGCAVAWQGTAEL